jgi:RHS repeat-associated protein
MPAGASLVQNSGTRAVQVVAGGTVIATVAPPVAVDATGTTVPVSMTVSGDTIALAVNLAPGQYQYPVYIDPTVTDKEVLHNPGNWLFLTDDPEVFKEGGSEGDLVDHKGANVTYYAGDYGYFSYNTQGASRIYAFVASAYEVHMTAPVLDQFMLRNNAGRVENGNGEEGYAKITELIHEPEIERTGITVCRETSCGPAAVSGSENNAAWFEQNAYTEGFSRGYFLFELKSASVEINQEAAPSASFDTSDSTIEGLPNALLSGKWYKSTSNVMFGVDAVDTGIGLDREGVSSPNKSGWGYTLRNEARNECKGAQCNQCYEPPCFGTKSGTGKPLTFSLTGATGGELPEGEDTVEGKVEDATGLNATPTAKFKVDNAPPHNITLSGLPSNHEIADGQHFLLKSSATDGVSGTISSGLASLVLQIDGQQIGGPQGSCSPGPCTGNAEWTLSGENYAAGQHTLSVVATDNAGNVATETFQVTIHHPEEIAAGPGSVNPVTGELSLTTTDVSLGVPDGGLTVSRSYRSRHLAQGTEGPLGPQWIMSLSAHQGLSRVSGGMVLTSGNGGQLVFESKGSGEFTSPTGDAGLILLEKMVEGKTIFTLTENGSVTTFEVPTGGSGGVWMPSSTEGPGGTSTTLYKFKVASGVIEPTEELAPVPAGVSCGKEISELKEGCRALKFEYDEGETKAKGENASEWNEFAGHLSKVKYIAWNASKVKTETAVAEYAYDIKGRLRAEWDPQVTPSPLKTTYGYDAEGHVTAVSGPGHEPSLLEQGTIPSDASTGRLLAVATPSAGTALGSGEAPKNTEAPTLSSTNPVVGTKINVKLASEMPGKWSASPLAFIYQWDDCNSSGKECTPIPGAVNRAYYPVAGDEGHTLLAQAIALNATGAIAASSATTSTVAKGTPNTPLPEPPSVGSDSVWTLEYQVPVSGSGAPFEMSSTELAKWGQADDPSEANAMAVFPPDRVMGWPAKEYKHETVYYLDGRDRAVNTLTPTGGISTTEYNAYNDVVRTLSPDNRKKAMEETGKTAEASRLLDTQSSYEETGSEPGTRLLSTLGPQHTVKLAVGKEGKTNEEALARAHTTYFYNEGAPSEGAPYHLVTKSIEGAETTSKEEFDKRTTTISFSGQSNLGWKLRKPTSVTTDPSGLDLTHTTEYESSTGNVIETKTPAALGKGSVPVYVGQFGQYGSGAGGMIEPKGTAIASSGNVYVTDPVNNRIDEFSSAGTFIETFGWGVSNGKEEFEVCKTGCKAGIAGVGSGQFKEPSALAEDSKGDLLVADTGNNRVQVFNSKNEYQKQFGKEGTAGGQFKEPKGIAVASSGNIFVSDGVNNRVEKFSEKGEFLATFGFGVSNGEEKFEICTTSCRAGNGVEGAGALHTPRGIAVAASGNVWVVDWINARIEEFKESGEYITTIGSKGTGNGQFNQPKGIAIDPTGGIWVADATLDRIQEFSATGTYLTTMGMEGTGNGQFKEPWGIAFTSTGSMYIADEQNNRVEQWAAPTVTGNTGAHDTKTIYYSTAANSEYKECGERPGLANLPCETKPVAQPETSGFPELPITKYTYNIWDEPETATETVGSTTRTKTETYDAAGRLKTSAIGSSVGTALPAVTYEYNSETGMLVKQCANEGKSCTEGKPKTITGTFNRLGELESYTDADETTSSYEYDVDGRVKKVNDGKGTEAFTYSAITGLPTELLSEYGTTKLAFTAAYDVEGNMLTEGYPNGMTAYYTRNSVGATTGLVYKKLTNCTEEEKEKCKWFTDAVVPSIHGQWLSQSSTLSKQAYIYDQAGRLTQVQNTPTGKGCTTRIYAYDEDTNRTSLTTRGPNAKEECATEGGTVEKHTYDTADRLTDTGASYDTFGDIKTLPATDVGGKESSEALNNTYYVNNRVASQEQNGQIVGDNLDPIGRTREIVSTGKKASDVINHYAGLGNNPAWTVNTASEWTRNIPGINGNLDAIQNNGETPVLQLTNLHGDIIATASSSETATELVSKADTSEFGVPTTSLPSKYSWLGSIELSTELPSGVITMGARSYVPQLGRFLQPDPVPGGSANAYSYTFGDPVNSTDPTGAYASTASAATLLALQGQGIAAQGDGERQRAEREAAERYAAELAARAAAEAAEAAEAAGPQYAGEEEWEEEEWEEEGAEYAAYHHGGEGDKGETHAEAATLDEEGASFGPGMELQGEGTAKAASSHSVIPLCEGRSEVVQAPCTRYANLWNEFKHEVGRAWHWFKKHVVHPVKHWVSEQWRAFKEKVSLLCPPFQMRVGGQCLEPSINLRDFPTAEG